MYNVRRDKFKLSSLCLFQNWGHSPITLVFWVQFHECITLEPAHISFSWRNSPEGGIGVLWHALRLSWSSQAGKQPQQTMATVNAQLVFIAKDQSDSIRNWLNQVSCSFQFHAQMFPELWLCRKFTIMVLLGWWKKAERFLRLSVLCILKLI